LASQQVGLILGAGCFVSLLILGEFVNATGPLRMAAVTALMACWWVTEAVPLAATSLMPLLCLPLLGVLDSESTASLYVNSTIFLFLGGFMLGRCMEAWGLHRRVALGILGQVGTGPRAVVLGLMLATAVLSMFISNTATVIIMLPIAMAILQQVEERSTGEEQRAFSVAVLLGIAYAASVGGMATLVGTPPNLAFQRIFSLSFPEAPPIGFGMWLLLGLPLSLLLLGSIWLALTRLFCRLPSDIGIGKKDLRAQAAGLGPMGFEEKVILAVFVTTALLWTFRLDLRLGSLVVPGWSRLLPATSRIDDGTVAMAMALLLFLVPVRHGNRRGSVMPRDVFLRLPWDVVLLFGGGFALAAGFQRSGLSELVAQQATALAQVPPFLAVLATCTTLTFLTEFASNTATVQLFLPILAASAVAMHMNPLFLMVPATLSASCAFMMPAGTPPNAMVFGSGRLRVADMARVGFWINLLGILLISSVFYVFGARVLNAGHAADLPVWVQEAPSVAPP
jgi:sodium-dependent dicarboxylate transporter 2/3/5